ncbi:hypothetical protein D3C77_432310 [compost metagenome]
MSSFHTVRIPWLGRFQRPHEHLIYTQRICSMLIYDNVRVDHVAAGFTHLLVVRPQNHPLVDKLLEWLLRRNNAKIIQHFVPETGVEQVKHRVFCSADV